MYTSAFFDSLLEKTKESAATVVPLVNEMVRPSSVLDVGCGAGTWLTEWSNIGVTDVLGIDGAYVDRKALLLPADKFKPVDVAEPFSLGRKFDLVQTLEVAEHLDESRADTFVESLASHGDTIMFSAAIPGQGGTHHVNERWPSYWAEKFEKAGFTTYDVIRPRIWSDPRVKVWYRQNILLFSRDRVFDGPQSCLDLVHPETWRVEHQQLRGVPQAMAALVRDKLGIRGA